jgi:hypothetical protein
MVNPTAKVDMVVPAKARAHTELMFLMNLQSRSPWWCKERPADAAAVSVCLQLCTTQSVAGQFADELCYHQPRAVPSKLEHYSCCCSCKRLHLLLTVQRSNCSALQELILQSAACHWPCTHETGYYAERILTGASPS